MKKRFLGSVAGLLAGAGMALAQTPTISSSRPATIPSGDTNAPSSLAAMARRSLTTSMAAPPTVAVDDPAPQNDRGWVTGEYLMWWIKGQELPPLVTTGSPTPTPGSVSDVLFGGDVDQNKMRSGGRFSAGYWLDDDQTVGVEGTFLFLGQRGSHLTTSSNGSPLLAIPFINPATGQETSYVVAAPPATTSAPFILPFLTLTTTTASSGSVAVSTSSKLYGAEANLLWNVASEPSSYRVGLLAGFRYARLDEDLTLTSDVTTNRSGTLTIPIILPFPLATGTTTTLVSRSDEFATRNSFYGGQIGAKAEFTLGRLFVRGVGKVAFGDTAEGVDITGAGNLAFRGATRIFPTFRGPTFTAASQTPLPGGFFAQPTNIGHYTRDVFAVIPEAGLTVGYQLTDNIRATVGYTFLYWSRVARPGNEIDRAISPAFLATPGFVLEPPVVLPPGARPTFTFHDSDFWAQGIDFGLEFTW